MDKQSLVTGLAAGTIGFGVAGTLAPSALLSIYGAEATPTARFMTRLWGSRNLALGVLTVQLEGKARDTLLQVAVGLNLVDALIGLVAPAVDGSPATASRAAAATSALFAGLAGYAASLD